MFHPEAIPAAYECEKRFWDKLVWTKPEYVEWFCSDKTWRWGENEAVGGKRFSFVLDGIERNEEKGEFAFVRDIHCRRPRDKVDKELKCRSLHWNTDDNLDRTLEERWFDSAERLQNAVE